jgi:FixJ family two-component response regulator
MTFQSTQLNKLVLVADEDLSSYKGMLRICQDQNTQVVHFVNQSALIDWINANQARIDASRIVCCLVIELAYVDVFENTLLPEHWLLYPKICISRSGSAETLLACSKIGLFDFIAKPFRLDLMKATLDRAFLHYQHDSLVRNRFKKLTKRELETCECLAKGYANKDIAEKMGISIKTVKVHRGNLMRKIDVKSIADLLRSYNTYQALSANITLSLPIGSTNEAAPE